jgi:hypothetical protein
MQADRTLKRGFAAAALLLSACASQMPSMPDSTASIAPASQTPTAQTPAGQTPAGQTAPGQTVSRLPGGYQLNQAELDLDCKKLSGRTAIRIVQIRDFEARRQSSSISKTIQKTSTTLLGGSYEGTDPDGRNARDRAMITAYNQRLIDKGCPSYDLNVELDPAAQDPPRLIQPKKS